MLPRCELDWSGSGCGWMTGFCKCGREVLSFNEILLGRQPHQDVKVLWHIRDRLHPHLQGAAGGLVEPKQITKYPMLCCVYLHWAWGQDGIWPLWLVGGFKRSLHLAWALCYWLYRMFQETNYQLQCTTQYEVLRR